MRRIIICNTYFQLITAIQLKLTLFINDIVTVVLTDHSKNAYAYFENLKKLNVFDFAYFLNCRNEDYDKSNFLKKIRKFCNISFGTSNNAVIREICSQKYDEIIFYNTSYTTKIIYANLYKFNHLIRSSRIEEGILSYSSTDFIQDFNFSKSYFVSKLLRKIFNKLSINSIIDRIYCFYPEVFKSNLNLVKIPSFNDNFDEISQILRILFNVKDEDSFIKEKYIFFSSVGDFEGGEVVGELDLALKIADIVGKENLIIKTHPRDTTGEFENAGLKVFGKSSVPWEAVMMSSDYSDKVFLTNTSGSVLSVNLCLSNGPTTYFLYDLCNNKNNSCVKDSEAGIREILKSFEGNPEFRRFIALSDLSKIV